jgi:hypothetical protein
MMTANGRCCPSVFKFDLVERDRRGSIPGKRLSGCSEHRHRARNPWSFQLRPAHRGWLRSQKRCRGRSALCCTSSCSRSLSFRSSRGRQCKGSRGGLLLFLVLLESATGFYPVGRGLNAPLTILRVARFTTRADQQGEREYQISLPERDQNYSSALWK